MPSDKTAKRVAILHVARNLAAELKKLEKEKYEKWFFVEKDSIIRDIIDGISQKKREIQINVEERDEALKIRFKAGFRTYSCGGKSYLLYVRDKVAGWGFKASVVNEFYRREDRDFMRYRLIVKESEDAMNEITEEEAAPTRNERKRRRE